MKLTNFIAITLLLLNINTVYANDFNSVNSSSAGVDVKLAIKNNIESVINEQVESDLLSYKATMHVSLIASPSTLKAQGLPAPSQDSLPVSSAALVNNTCQLNIVFDDNGNLPAFNDEKIINILQFKNAIQKRMAQEFLSLHEQYHCEFRNINEPIIAQGQNIDFNKKINFILKEDISYAALNKIAYIDLLNENFADVSAMFSLIKRYGMNDSNLIFVLNSFVALRHYEYFYNDIDIHFSYFSMKDALSPFNINKVLSIFNNSNNKLEVKNAIQQLALEICNNGIGTLLSNKPILVEFVFPDTPIVKDIYINTLQLVIRESIDSNIKESVIINPWSSNVERGYTFTIAQNLINNENIKNMYFYTPDGSPGKNHKAIFDYIGVLLKNKQPDLINSQFHQNSLKQISVFKNTLVKQSDDKALDYISKFIQPSELQKKINTLTSEIQKKN